MIKRRALNVNTSADKCNFPTDRPITQPTDQQTDMRGHRDVTLTLVRTADHMAIRESIIHCFDIVIGMHRFTRYIGDI